MLYLCTVLVRVSFRYPKLLSQTREKVSGKFLKIPHQNHPTMFPSSLSHLDGGVRGLAPHPLSHVAPVDDGRRVAAPRLAPQRRTLPRHRRRGVRPVISGYR